MTKKFILLSLLATQFFSLGATYISYFSTDYEHFSLVFFTVDKNILHVERYPLNELLQNETNFISKKMSSNKCSHVIYLSERGLKIGDMVRHAQSETFLINAYRGKNKVSYHLSWAKLLLNDAQAAQDFMHAQLDLQQAPDFENGKGMNWHSYITVSWGPHKESNFSFAFEREIETAHALIIPTVLCKNLDAPQTLTRQDAMAAGIITLAPQAQDNLVAMDQIYRTSTEEHAQVLKPQQVPAQQSPQTFIQAIKEKTNAFIAAIIALIKPKEQSA
jgi:hypothetical protein